MKQELVGSKPTWACGWTTAPVYPVATKEFFLEDLHLPCPLL